MCFIHINNQIFCSLKDYGLTRRYYKIMSLNITLSETDLDKIFTFNLGEIAIKHNIDITKINNINITLPKSLTKKYKSSIKMEIGYDEFQTKTKEQLCIKYGIDS